MRALHRERGRRGIFHRWLVLAALALFIHAVAIDLFHSHAAAAAADAGRPSTTVLAPQPPDGRGAAGDLTTNCPACQLQRSFVFDIAPSPSALCEGAVDPAMAGLYRWAILRAGDTSPPDRAPPIL